MALRIEDYFKKPEFTVPRRLLCVASGPPKTGKTTFALSAAAIGKLGYMNWDWGEEGVIHKAPEHKNILECRFEPPQTMLLDNTGVENTKALAEYVKAWNDAVTAYRLAIKEFPTTVVDTATEQYESCRLAYHGQLEKVKARWFGPVNADMRRLFRDAVESGHNVIWIAKHKDEYIGDSKTGKKLMAGFGEMGYLSQINVECYRKDVKGKSTFGVRILDSKHNPSLNGMEFDGCDFPMLLSLVHG